MLIRIVRMTFKPEAVDTFLSVFNEHKDQIRSFPGCSHLELQQDYHQPHVFATYSYWEDDSALDKYRHSDLFKGVWAKTKIHFSDKPIAFSHRRLQTL
ncbi:putative quinol monooxygenase [Fulvivirga sediminis]|uniref:Antibiotic biosynthesis monooxygenase n=1 Tax=Fulvivirga sediminis TaxID=2803949 RepID=A0A937F8Z6_9BACT|nr:antibiotic biosynthesis monooxygenase family protein [Fulvivirga sediminis]MBL3658521.1 antibiotic biosynthesis monooxygenase [Fulvivirga sediminis]